MRANHFYSRCLCGLLIFSLLANPLLADGKAFMRGIDDTRFKVLDEEAQSAVIVMKEGREHLAIAIKVELADAQHAVWIFPLPAQPEQIKVDVLKEMPYFHGHDPRAKLHSQADLFCALLRASQLYPAIFDAIFTANLLGGKMSASLFSSTVRHGIRADLITAQSTEALAEYISGLGAKMDAKELSSFSNYCNENYSFVVCSIASIEELKKSFPELENHYHTQTVPTLYASFPAEKPFYPMVPTSGYGDKRIPVSLQVTGHVKLDCADPWLQQYTKASYFAANGERYCQDAPVPFCNLLLGEKDIFYTSFYLKTEAERFCADFYFSPDPQTGFEFALWLERQTLAPVLAFLLVLGLLSYLAAGFAGLSVFGEWKKWARFGFWNFLTLYAVLLRMRYLKPAYDPRLDKEYQTEMQIFKYKYRSVFVSRFTMFFLLETIVLQLAVNLLPFA